LAGSGRKYVRPEEAEQRIRDLEAELERLRAAQTKKGRKPKS
jgi:hypothetical protein